MELEKDDDSPNKASWIWGSSEEEEEEIMKEKEPEMIESSAISTTSKLNQSTFSLDPSQLADIYNCTSLLMGDNLQMHEEMDNDSVFFDFSNFTTEEFLESSNDEEFPQMHLTQLSDEEHESIDEYDYEYGCNSINYSKECDKLFLPSGNLDFGKDITLPFMMLPLSLQNCVSKNSTKAIKNLHPHALQVIIFKNLIIIADLFLLKIFTKTVCFFYSLKIC